MQKHNKKKGQRMYPRNRLSTKETMYHIIAGRLRKHNKKVKEKKKENRR
jgi:hypothetical protein